VSKWQAVVFDLDDTLYPERDYVFSGFRAVAGWAERNLGIPASQGFTELQSLFESGVRGDTFDRWLAMHGHGDNLVPKLVQVYREHEPKIAPFPNVSAILAKLHTRFRLGLLSDGYLDVQRRKLAALKISKYFDEVLFSDTLGRQYWKPAPKPFEMLLYRLGVKDPGEAVYIADNPLKDFLGAKQIGMGTIWLRWPEGEYANLEPPTDAHKPDVQTFSLLEVFSLLEEGASNGE
jgi:putative hydrolase of the HAD superfamily